MAYLLALRSAALYGAADFLGGLASRRANTLAIVVTSQGYGLTLLVLSLPTNTRPHFAVAGMPAHNTSFPRITAATPPIPPLRQPPLQPALSTFESSALLPRDIDAPIVLSRRTSPHPIQRTRGCGADGGEPTAGGVDQRGTDSARYREPTRPVGAERPT